MTSPSRPPVDPTVPAGEPTDAQRLDALDWLLREANTRRVSISLGCQCFIGIERREALIEENDLRGALDALIALQEDTADVE